MTDIKKLLEAIDEQEKIIEYVVENYASDIMDMLQDEFRETIEPSDFLHDRY